MYSFDDIKYISRSQFIKLGKLETDPIDSCCPLRIKTGVQILGSVLAILSGALLVLFFARLDELVRRQYFQLYQVVMKIYQAKKNSDINF